MRFFMKEKIAFLIESKNILNLKLFDLIKNISENSSILDAIIHNQRQYLTKNW